MADTTADLVVLQAERIQLLRAALHIVAGATAYPDRIACQALVEDNKRASKVEASNV